MQELNQQSVWQYLYAYVLDVPYKEDAARSGLDLNAEQSAYLIDVKQQINEWLKRGDSVVFYRNQDLGHLDLGQVRIASFGSDVALLTRAQYGDEPPKQLPDIGPAINWRYQIDAIYSGDPL